MLTEDKYFKKQKWTKRKTFIKCEANAVYHWMALFTLLSLSQHSNMWWRNVKAQVPQTTGIWKTGEWDACEGRSCGDGGVQLRSVTCEDASLHHKMRKENCVRNDEPSDRRNCFTICDQHRNEFRWKLGEWQDCEHSVSRDESSLSKISNCGIHSGFTGTQVREVLCVSLTNNSVVVDNHICTRFFGSPDAQRSCRVPCPHNCVVSVFGSWSACSTSCGNRTQTRTRHVIRLAKYGGTDCPVLSETKLCQVTAECPEDEWSNANHKLKFEKWSQCKQAKVNSRTISRSGLSSKNNQRRKARVVEHLIGTRKRKVGCLTEFGQSIGESITISETCAVTQDCTISNWSNWSACTASCGVNGTQTRRRDVYHLPQGYNATACPRVTDARQCVVDSDSAQLCLSYSWLPVGWSSCELIHNASCGGGLQWRHVYCVQQDNFTQQQASTTFSVEEMNGANTWEQLQAVESSYCDKNVKPHQWKECNIPCKHKCDIGQWSDWSACALLTCPGDPSYVTPTQKSRRKIKKHRGFKRRRRIIHNDYGAREDCAHTLEVIPCADARCFSWHIVDVSSCQPDHGQCGSGKNMNTLECRDMWGGAVDDDMCDLHPGAYSVPQLETCHVPCSADCVLGEWSSWSPCVHTCKRGKRESRNQTRKRQILAKSGPHGTPCPRQDDLTQSRMCNQHDCSVHFWNKLQWGECQLSSFNSTSSCAHSQANDLLSNDSIVTSYQEGYQTRKVVCKKKESGKVPRKKCIEWDKPASHRTCMIPCSRDCVLSAWSEWSSCEKECNKLIGEEKKQISTDASTPAGLASVYQHRQRYIVQHRVDRGVPCMRKLKEDRLCSDQCSVYKWHISKWSPCLLANGMSTRNEDQLKCKGLKTRIVSCYMHTLMGSVPTSTSNCVQDGRPIPHATRPCHTQCRRDFAFTEWQQRLGCQATMSQLTTLAVTEDIETTVNEETTRVLQQATARPVGGWSSCFLDITDFQDRGDDCPVSDTSTVEMEVTSSQPLTAPSCGRGKRKRSLGCFEEGTNTMLDISYCNYRAFDEEECEVPCPVDCVMSPWARWGDCGNLLEGQTTSTNNNISTTYPCGENRKIRFKYFLDEPINGGRACPVVDSLGQVYQAQLCHSECNDNFWVAMGWNTCSISEAGTFSTCGTGTQTQTVDCYKTSRSSGFANFARQLYDDMLCDVDNTPYGSLECELPCPGKCVVSEWQPWQPCSSGATVNSCDGSVMTRTRQIIRHSELSLFPSSDCPDIPLTETQECKLNVNCYTYSVQWTEWSSCMLSQNAKCGIGYKKRRANCVRSDGLPVHYSKCISNDIAIPISQAMLCNVECPVDCLLSDWSTWSGCSASCGMHRVRTRSREIVREASFMGRKCGDEVVQTRPCCYKPCYRWRLLEWGECILSHDNCGVGIQERNIKCEQEDGLEVDPLLCKEVQVTQDGGNGQLHDWFKDFQLLRSCHVPCPGECGMSDWSSWSQCHADCDVEENNGKPGVKARSRIGFVVGDLPGIECPGSEVEKTECSPAEAACFTYSWKVGTYIGHTREVWCEREQDNFIVATGCQNDLKPPHRISSPYCSQPCDSVERGYCTSTGVCGCQVPYSPLYQDNVYLRGCVEPEQHDQGTVHIKTVDPRNNSPDKKTPDSIKPKPSPTTIPPVLIQPANESNADSDWNMFYPIKPDGSLKVWAYGAIAGLIVLLVFIIAISYLTYSACHRSTSQKANHKRRKRHRRNNSSGSNVGVGLVVSSGGGSSAYGGTGLPPYYMSAPTTSVASRYTPVRGLSRTSSARSGFSFPDRYDSDVD